MVEFPTGTVTFLFTDIVGSTSLWDSDPDRMRAAMVKHDRETSAAVFGHRGLVVKHTGDGVFAAFDSPMDALLASVDLHVAATSIDDESFCVRVGIHTGEADHRDDDYFGPNVSRAERVMSTANARETHLSAITEALVCDGLPDGLELSRPSEIELRGFARPERIVRVIAAGADRAGPLGSPRSPRRAVWVAVLPMTNPGDEASEEYFADGITEDLLTRLGRFAHSG